MAEFQAETPRKPQNTFTNNGIEMFKKAISEQKRI